MGMRVWGCEDSRRFASRLSHRADCPPTGEALRNKAAKEEYDAGDAQVDKILDAGEEVGHDCVRGSTNDAFVVKVDEYEHPAEHKVEEYHGGDSAGAEDCRLEHAALAARGYHTENRSFVRLGCVCGGSRPQRCERSAMHGEGGEASDTAATRSWAHLGGGDLQERAWIRTLRSLNKSFFLASLNNIGSCTNDWGEQMC